MRRGVLPGQEEAIQARLAQLRADKQRQRRRAFLGAAGMSLVTGALGYASARLLTPRDATAREILSPPPMPARLRWAVELAEGPKQPFVREGHMFLSVVDQYLDRPELHPGIRRLGLLASELEPRRGGPLVRRVLRLVTRHPQARGFAPLREHLEARLRKGR